MEGFSWQWILGPLIGSIIGYFTNLLAVKMLFFPLEEKRILGIRVPFTPGIIPKEKERLARKIGETVGEDIFTKDDLTEGLISESIKLKIEEEIHSIIEASLRDKETIKDKLDGFLSKDKVAKLQRSSKEVLSNTIYKKIVEMNLGEKLSIEVSEAIKKRTQPSFMLSLIMGDKVIDEFKEGVSYKINDYIRSSVHHIISEKVDLEVDNILFSETKDLVIKIGFESINYSKLAVRIYEEFVINHLDKLIESMNISKIVEDKIRGMEVDKVEGILLSVMKKELSAIINLGALIGFILGIIMIFV